MSDKDLGKVIKTMFDACGTITEALRKELVTVAEKQESVFGDVQAMLTRIPYLFLSLSLSLPSCIPCPASIHPLEGLLCSACQSLLVFI